jgi:hypothetical protein
MTRNYQPPSGPTFIVIITITTSYVFSRIIDLESVENIIKELTPEGTCSNQFPCIYLSIPPLLDPPPPHTHTIRCHGVALPSWFFKSLLSLKHRSQV